ncbi:hypothetical protein [Bernardetia sp.]|uniref:hypothetical protein n=1 Tax=Bernardetia sp. TaxID=1937974 RepID=UPI0025C277EE|nr:hypothetical protein [Bernardetia sp.]
MSISLRIFTFLLAFHILNFSLDIPSYHSSTNNRVNGSELATEFEQDEIESIMELVVETALQESDFFPDTEENNSPDHLLKKVDWIVQGFTFDFSLFQDTFFLSHFTSYTQKPKDVAKDILPPPPKV